MKKVDPRFQKFTKKKSNAAIKEAFKQEKRQYKKERAAYFEQKKKEAAQQLAEGPKIPRVQKATEQMPLNKYLAHGGICSRRDAADMIKDGKVKVNGKVITEPGYKMNDGDEVIANGKKVFLSKNLVYILMNKPKDYITTTDDPQNRKTVLDLIKTATKERVYPVGRLDRNTSGVLLITNDGELAQMLTHPSNEVKKIYAVTLDKPLEKGDFDKILKGVILEDGPAYVDVLAYSDASDKTQIGVEIHSGRNRIVRRIFESQGYEVKNLDRVMFAGLTKKNVERGKFRFLTEKEVRNLKYLGKDKKNAAEKKPVEDEFRKEATKAKPKFEGERPLRPRIKTSGGDRRSGLENKKPFGTKKPAFAGDRKPRIDDGRAFKGKPRFDGEKNFGAKSSFAGNKKNGAGENRAFGGKPRFSSEEKKPQTGGRKPAFGERKDFGKRPPRKK